MKDPIKLRSGVFATEISLKEAQAKNYLNRSTLALMHLSSDAPVAYTVSDAGYVFWFDPERVSEAEPEEWYSASPRTERMTLPSGNVICRMSTRRAAALGYYSRERLAAMHLDAVEEPVAFTKRANRETVYFYDKMTALKTPLNCIKCGKDVRYRKKLCRACYEEDLAQRRAEGDEHRGAHYGMRRERVLFFDLELTGVYDRDEIISISICDANGKIVMDTLVHPTHTKKWKHTEKIHGITPEMTANAVTLAELTPEIKSIFAEADNIIAYGVSTDYSHIRHIYETEEEQAELKAKTRCCANEFVRYIHEHRPDISHASLSDAMACFGIEWDGTAHTSIADTVGCMKVWEKLFPNYYAD